MINITTPEYLKIYGLKEDINHMKNNLEEVFTPKTTEEIIKDQLELKEKAYQNYLLVHDYNGSISIREDFMAGFDEGAGSRGFFGRYSASLNNRNKQLEQELQKKSNMLAKVKRYFGISVRKNSEMRQELQKTREQLEKAAVLMKTQKDCIDHLLGKKESFGDKSTIGFGKRVDDFLDKYFKDKQGEG